jgi:hypothetical protein
VVGIIFVGAVTTTSSSNQDVKKSDFGKASSLCMLVRLAVGEWKIQLGLWLMNRTLPGTTAAGGGLCAYW